MDNSRVFKVSVIGLASNEQNTLGSIFKLAAARPRQYTLVSPQEPSNIEILLVDADDKNAMNKWQNDFSVHHGKIPIVKVIKAAPPEGSNETYLRRPLTLKRVLEVLDRVTIEHLKFVPDPIGGKSENPSPADIKIITDIINDIPSTGIKALVVDDAETVRKSMEIQLKLFGMAIDFAVTGEQALEFTQKNVYHIIFLDLMLPGIDGYKVCKEIKSHKLSKNTPVVMLTGKGSRFDKLRGTMAGANVYLTKPAEPEELKKVIKQFLPNIADGSTK